MSKAEHTPVVPPTIHIYYYPETSITARMYVWILMERNGHKAWAIHKYWLYPTGITFDHTELVPNNPAHFPPESGQEISPALFLEQLTL
jgi:hypothetical protein